VKTAVGSELSLVSGTYHENKVSVVMEMASFFIKIRHVFADTSLTERSIGAGPPVIIQLSGFIPCHVFILLPPPISNPARILRTGCQVRKAVLLYKLIIDLK
jgi:hypothetical protein